MKVYTLKEEVILPIDIDEAWEFFSSPLNLEKITPKKLNFKVISELPVNMYAGLIIQYFIRPILGIKLRWVTEITHVNKPYLFVDEQRIGPYQLWHHQHHFIETDNGVLIKDEVNYALPYGILGRLLHRLMIKSELRHIFAFRKKSLNQIFHENQKLSKGAA